MQLVVWLDDDAAVAQGQHAFFPQADVFLVFLAKHSKPRLLLPMRRNFPQPSQARLFVFRVRLEAVNHFSPPFFLGRSLAAGSCWMALSNSWSTGDGLMSSS